MSQANELCEQIATFFLLNDRTWTIDNEERIPTEEDVKLCLAKVAETLRQETTSVGTTCQMVIGGMIVKLIDDKFDVYLYLGEYSDND